MREGVKMTDREALVGLLQHLQHRINEFFAEHKVEDFSDMGQLAADFSRFLRMKDDPRGFLLQKERTQ